MWPTQAKARGLRATGGNRRMWPVDVGLSMGRRLATGGNRRMWPADIGANDGWGAGGCGRLSPPILIFGPCLAAIDEWVIPPLLKVLEQSNTVPRVCSGFG